MKVNDFGWYLDTNYGNTWQTYSYVLDKEEGMCRMLTWEYHISLLIYFQYFYLGENNLVIDRVIVWGDEDKEGMGMGMGIGIGIKYSLILPK